MFNWLKKLINEKQSDANETRGRHFKTKKNLIPKTSEANFANLTIPEQRAEPNPHPSSTITKISEPIQHPSTIIVDFVSIDGDTLAQSQVISGQIGDPLHFQPPKINGYFLVDTNGITKRMERKKQTITVKYAPELGKPVIIYCFDFDTLKLLRKPIILSGPLTEEYQIQAPKIEGYGLHQSIGNLFGSYGRQLKNVALYYRKDSWELVQDVHYLVKLKMDASVFRSPNGSDAYPQKLPKNSVWRAFKEVITTHGTYLNVGGAQWIEREYADKTNFERKQLKK